MQHHHSSIIDQIVDEPTHPTIHREKAPRPVAVNQPVWDDLYQSRNARTRALKRRVDNEVSMIMLLTKLEDRDVLKAAQALAHRLPVTAVRDEYLHALTQALQSIKRQRINGESVEVVGKEQLLKLMSIKGPDLTQEGLNEKAFWDYQLVKLLSKYPFAGYDEIAEHNALDEFVRCEEQNARTNKAEHLWTPQNELINELREIITKLLGDPPTHEEIMELGKWGPGTMAGYIYRSSETGAEMKFNAPLTMTPEALPLASMVLPQYQLWYGHLKAVFGPHWVSLQPGGKLQTVPKKFLMKRTMIAEPSLNSWIQLAIGAVIRKRLRRFGWDLDTCWAVNQRLAVKGSISGAYSTLDMRNASNTLAYRLIESVLPEPWFAWLKSVRSPKVLLPPYLAAKGLPSPYKLQMFSSMGNGFTFELESVVFMAAVLVACGKRPGVIRPGRLSLEDQGMSVFGDDVVLPQKAAASFIEIAQEIGLEVNQEKSFVSGPFRESCGLDSYGGVNIRPLLISKRMENGFDLVTIANRVLSHAHRLADEPHNSGYASSRWAGMWASLIAPLPTAIKNVLWTPPFVDGGLWTYQFGPVPSIDQIGDKLPVYRVVKAESSSLKLTYEQFSFRKGYHSCEWMGNGDNLLCARIGPRQSDPDSWRKPEPGTGPKDLIERSIKGTVFKGDVSDLRFTTCARVSFSRISRSSSWCGWRTLYSDFC